LGSGKPELSIVFVDDVEITRLNRRYLGRNRSTNVISFPMAEGDPVPNSPQVLGDVVLSAETAERQARRTKRNAEDEILFLLIHGILHLLGYDHITTPGERRKMREKERELFALIAKKAHSS
jgi:probable rRNA maturation factor